MKWEGELKTRIKPLSRSADFSKLSEAEQQAEDEAAIDHIMFEQLRKLDLLAEGLGIQREDQDKYFRIALVLATVYVPGFRVKGKGPRLGRPREWDIWRRCALIADVHFVMRQKNVGVTEACRHLTRREPYRNRWAPQLEGTRSDSEARRAADSLVARYNESRKPGSNALAVLFWRKDASHEEVPDGFIEHFRTPT